MTVCRVSTAGEDNEIPILVYQVTGNIITMYDV